MCSRGALPGHPCLPPVRLLGTYLRDQLGMHGAAWKAEVSKNSLRIGYGLSESYLNRRPIQEPRTQREFAGGGQCDIRGHVVCLSL